MCGSFLMPHSALATIFSRMVPVWGGAGCFGAFGSFFLGGGFSSCFGGGGLGSGLCCSCLCASGLCASGLCGLFGGDLCSAGCSVPAGGCSPEPLCAGPGV